ncbi:hypothetical protein EGW08_013745 [Elysia chlorotica]|uniref:Uncharacterized protein n=1 Tax=Elysia chlorotica TaxID=188477 RepID=A0A3S0ZYR4_ELYCH|nr:hypothetical protein EGW08_013745 [Elysia chlorotica]
MPRLLSSYAANKRVEDGLRRKQEQIRQEYVRARHRYMDETDKLINDLIQIHVKTPNAFHRNIPPNSAPSYTRAGRGGVFPSHGQGIQLPHHLSSQQQQQTTAEILEETSHALRSIPREDLGPPTMPAVIPQENGRVGAGGSRSAPVRRARQGAGISPRAANPQPPVVQIRGDEVFYQYDNGKRPSGWKKIEPAYRTKVLLHRNNTVSQALLKQQSLAATSNVTTTDNDIDAGNRSESSSMPRKRSLFGADARRVRVGAGGSRSAPVRRARQGAGISPRAANPQPPVVQIRGDEVFYQYDNGKRPSGWKKIEPAYRTKVLLHRNNTVSQALLKQQSLAATSNVTTTDNDIDAGNRAESSSMPRKRSLFGADARRDSELYGRRDSLFSRRSSRRGSRFFEDMEDDVEEDLKAERFAKLMQKQLSPGHTPRMLDGWTIMNWCLWNKRSEKPIWATKRYMEKKRREVKKYEATRAREKKDVLPEKPSSAKSRSKENAAGASGTDGELQRELKRSKSVPLQTRDTTFRLEGVHEEEEEEEIAVGPELQADKYLTPRILEPPDRGILRPTTSVLRSSELANGLGPSEKDDALRPKTTHSRRRVALDSFMHAQDNSLALGAEGSRDGCGIHENSDEYNNKPESGPPSHRSAKGCGGEKGEGERRRTISINECPQILEIDQQGPQSPRPLVPSLVQPRALGQRADLEDRMPGLAATKISTINDSVELKKSLSSTKKTQNVTKKLSSVQAGTVIFPKVKSVVPELGTDSPRQL